MKNLVFISILVISVFASCKKGDTGPVGSTGETGPAGANGSVILSGTATPSASEGNVGDYYLNTQTCLLYGPKTASGWGTSVSLKGNDGATGATGAAGSKILQGDTVPAQTLGGVGDYYLDTLSYLLYGPKKAPGWGAGFQLGAPVSSYIFKVPYSYIYSSNTSCVQFRIPFDEFNCSDSIAQNGLLLVYLNVENYNCWMLANGTLGFFDEYFSCRYNFEVYESVLYLYTIPPAGTTWADIDAAKTAMNLEAIKIVIVPPGKVTFISKMKTLDYVEVMKVLSK
jgi:hypothetical protein